LRAQTERRLESDTPIPCKIVLISKVNPGWDFGYNQFYKGVIMKKTSFFFTILPFIIISCFFVAPLQANPVGLETAIRVGVNIYAERADLRTSDIQVIEGITKKENSENLFYIFNIQDHGYVMIAADDAVFPVLGYNFNHHYTEENHPPQFDAMLESFSEQIVHVKENEHLEWSSWCVDGQRGPITHFFPDKLIVIIMKLYFLVTEDIL